MLGRLKLLLFATLRRQLVVVVVLSMALMMAAFVWDMTRRQKAVLLDQATSVATSLAQSIAASSAVWLAARDFSGLQEIIEAQRGYAGLEFAMVIDPYGLVLAHSDLQLRGKYLADLPKDTGLRVLRRTSALVDVVCPVMLAGQHKGWVRVGLAQTATTAKLAEITRNGVLYALVALAICTVLVILMAAQLTRRLLAIQGVADSVLAGQGDLRVQVTGHDEAAQLAQRFNQMLDALAKREAELNNYRQHLEALVEERTSDLERARDAAEAANQGLRQTTDFLNSLITYANAPIIVWDPELRITQFNQAFERLTGLEAAAVTGQSLDIIFAPDQWDRIMEHSLRTAAAEPLEAMEIPIRHVDGSVRVVLWNFACIQEREGGCAAATIAQGQDISERKRAETELSDQLAFVRILADTIPSPVYFKDTDGRYVWGNKAYKYLRGEEELAGKTMRDFLQPDAAAFHEDMEREMYARNNPISYEYETFTKAGERREVIFHKAPFRDSEGRVKGLVAVMSDITDRNRAEKDLRQSEEILQKILLGIKAGIIIVDPGTFTVVDVNAIAEEILGAPRSALVGKSCKSIRWIRETDGATDETCPLITDNMVNEEYRIERPGGSIVPVLKTVISAIRSGQILFYEIMFDMTARKAMERKLVLAQRLESIGGLAAGIAHEINTPIQYVGDNLSFLQGAFAGLTAAVQGSMQHGEPCGAGLDLAFLLEEVPKALTQSSEGVARVAEIVRAMKRFSHPGGEDKALLDVPKAIENTILVARNEWKYHAEVTLDLDPAAEFLLCFPGDFNQVLLNILVNASHAISEKYKDIEEKGIITITTKREGESFVMSVSDTGCGIPEKNLHRVFDQFFTTKEIGKGTGQGLALVHDVMKKHGGSVEVESALGRGTTFILRFPRPREEGAAP